MGVAGNILVIETDGTLREACLHALRAEGYRARGAGEAREGLARLAEEAFDAVLLDLDLPEGGDATILTRLREDNPNTLVIASTARPSVEGAVAAMRAGATDFLPKPFAAEALLAVFSRALGRRRIQLEDLCLRPALDERLAADHILGESAAMRKLVGLLPRVAASEATVLICGESGTGKELVARALHRHSPRHTRPLVSVDCGALVETLFESELFGHVRGAFTGATETTVGKFELADGGTIFLDEIGNISLPLQAKLLRVLQEREICKVGSARRVPIDARVVAATNTDPLTQIEKGELREDLFYRLSVVLLRLPPLRERREDIPLLAGAFLRRFAHRRQRAIHAFSDEARRSLIDYDWPGNVRELENAIERAVIMADGDTIQAGDLAYYWPHPADAPEARPEEGGLLAQTERREILRALDSLDWQIGKTAEHLGIHRKTLREKMKRFGLQR